MSKITFSKKDNYLHRMLFDIYMGYKDEDPSYYDLFQRDIENGSDALKVDVDFLFYYKDEIKIFKKYENEKFKYADIYIQREFYSLHYLSFCILDELALCCYKHRIFKHSDGYISFLPNESNFKRIRKHYIEITRTIALKLHIGEVNPKIGIRCIKEFLENRDTLNQIIKKELKR